MASFKISKFPLEELGNTIIEIPKEHNLLGVQVVFGTPCVYAMVDPEAPKIERIIETFETEQEVEYDPSVQRSYLGTYQLNIGRYFDREGNVVHDIAVRHVFIRSDSPLLRYDPEKAEYQKGIYAVTQQLFDKLDKEA